MINKWDVGRALSRPARGGNGIARTLDVLLVRPNESHCFAGRMNVQHPNEVDVLRFLAEKRRG
jgi:hypothetical protein